MPRMRAPPPRSYTFTLSCSVSASVAGANPTVGCTRGQGSPCNVFSNVVFPLPSRPSSSRQASLGGPLTDMLLRADSGRSCTGLGGSTGALAATDTSQCSV
eukprot:17986-Heterococcus_DN1.PRE.3